MVTQHTENGIKITISFHSGNPNTIANRLSEKLGREATDAELGAEVKRIMKSIQDETP